jgi:hypothetical protein
LPILEQNPDLTEVIEAWPNLSGEVKASIIETSRGVE